MVTSGYTQICHSVVHCTFKEADIGFGCRWLNAFNPELSCGIHRGGAAKSGVVVSIETKVIFFHYSSAKIADFARAVITVHMKGRPSPPSSAVDDQDCAADTLVSMDSDKLGQKTKAVYTRFHKKIQTFQRHTDIISVVHANCREIASGPPMSGNIPDGPHTDFNKR